MPLDLENSRKIKREWAARSRAKLKAENPEALKEFDRQKHKKYYERESKNSRDWFLAHKDAPEFKEVQRKRRSRYYDKNKDREFARSAVRKAVLAGKLEKLSCGICGTEKVQAHHHKGYERENWLVITWLCQKHHTAAHTEMKRLSTLEGKE